MAPPVFGVRAKPLDPLTLDRRTLAELVRVLEDRLKLLESVNHGAGCPSCRDAEATAFLAQLRHLITTIDAGQVTPAPAAPSPAGRIA